MKKPSSLLTIFMGLWRRRLLVGAIVLITVSSAFIILSLMPPRYSASARVVVKTGQVDRSVENIKSRQFAMQIIDQLNLMADPAFNPRFADTKKPDKFKTLSLYQGELARLSPRVLREDRAAVTRNFLNGLSVQAAPNTNIISVTYSALSAEKAAYIVNNIADFYVAQQFDQDAVIRTQEEAAKRAVEREELRDALRLAEKNFMTLRVSEQMEAQNNAEDQTLSKLRSELAAAKAQYNDVVTKPQKSKVPPQNLALINSLKRQSKAIKASIAKLSERYGEKHPKMIAQRRALSKIRSRLYAARGIVAVEVEHEADIALARVNNMQRIINSMEAQAAPKPKAVPEKSDELAALEDLVVQASEALAAFDAEVEPAEITPVITPTIKVVSYAEVPRDSYWPNIPFILSLVGGLAFAFAVVIAALLSVFDKTCRNEKQLSVWFDAPCLAVVSLAKSIGSSAQGQALKRLYVTLCLRKDHAEDEIAEVTERNEDSPTQGSNLVVSGHGRVFSVMGPDGDDHALKLAIDFARLAAKEGDKVLLIDADLHRAPLHVRLGHNNTVSLVDYLTGDSEVERIINTQDQSGVHMIYGRSVPHSALDLIKSTKFSTLIAAFKQAYDVVVLYAPSHADAAVVAHLSDQMMYAITADKTPHHAVVRDLKHLRDAAYQKVGLVLVDENGGGHG